MLRNILGPNSRPLAGLIGLALSCFAVHGQGSSSIQLLIPNPIQRVEAGAGETRSIEGSWIGLICIDQQWVVREVTVRNSAMSPALMFSFLVRGIPGLPNKAKLIYSGGKGGRIEPEAPLKRSFDGKPIEIAFAPTRGAASTGTPSEIAIRFMGHEQKIQCHRGVESSSLIWFGDIDFDGKPDFVIHTRDDNGNYYVTLHLSSIATPRNLIGEAAVFGYQADG